MTTVCRLSFHCACRSIFGADVNVEELAKTDDFRGRTANIAELTGRKRTLSVSAGMWLTIN